MTVVVEDIVSSLSLEDKILLLAGFDFWHTNAVEGAGIPALRLSDGPVGVRGERSVGPRSVSFPCGIAIGATFDPAAARQLGEALADECLDKSVNMLLGPTVNLHRHPLGGRHFESYSEDPWLSARLCVEYVSALQARGVAATIKHFVANDSEFERHTISSDVDEPTLRELYLVPFEAAVHDAGAWAVMSAYNKVNGTYAAEHEGLLEDTLRSEWGFDGLVVSDWFGTQSTAASANAGLDLEMPGPAAHYGARLREAVDTGSVSAATIDEHVRRLLVLGERTGAFGTRDGAARSVADRQEVARRLAIDSFVLLRNESNTLPFSLSSGSTVAVIGPNAASTTAQGGGSARVNAVERCSVLDSLRKRLEPQGVSVVYERGCVTWAATPALEADFRLAYFARDADAALYEHDASVATFTWLGDPAPAGVGLSDGNWTLQCSASLTPDAGGEWLFSLTQIGHARLLVDDQVVVDATGEVGRSKAFFGFGSEEAKGSVALEGGREYGLVVEYEPRAGLALAGLMIGAVPPVDSDEDLLRRAEAAASRADAVVCVVGTTAEWETEGHDRATMDMPGLQTELVRRVASANARTCVLVNAGTPVTMDWAGAVPAVAQIWFPGEQGGEAVADVLLGDADPGGRLPTTIPLRLEDTPAFAHYPGEDGHVVYGERLLMGYRHYDANGVEPLWPFGHGLSYTTFGLSDLAVGLVGSYAGSVLPHGLVGEALVEVTASVANLGDRTGVEVVQCYVARSGRGPSEPVMQLRGVAKLELAPGESQQVRLTLNERSFARWDVALHGFVASAGEYEILVGRSSRDLPLRTIVALG